MHDLSHLIHDFGRRARAAARRLRQCDADQKNRAIVAMADRLIAEQDGILAANQDDLAKAKAEGLSNAMIDRLTLDGRRLLAMANGIREVAALPEPVGEIIRDWIRPNGLRIQKV